MGENDQSDVLDVKNLTALYLKVMGSQRHPEALSPGETLAIGIAAVPMCPSTPAAQAVHFSRKAEELVKSDFRAASGAARKASQLYKEAADHIRELDGVPTSNADADLQQLSNAWHQDAVRWLKLYTSEVQMQEQELNTLHEGVVGRKPQSSQKHSTSPFERVNTVRRLSHPQPSTPLTDNSTSHSSLEFTPPSSPTVLNAPSDSPFATKGSTALNESSFEILRLESLQEQLVQPFLPAWNKLAQGFLHAEENPTEINRSLVAEREAALADTLKVNLANAKLAVTEFVPQIKQLTSALKHDTLVTHEAPFHQYRQMVPTPTTAPPLPLSQEGMCRKGSISNPTSSSSSGGGSGSRNLTIGGSDNITSSPRSGGWNVVNEGPNLNMNPASSFSIIDHPTTKRSSSPTSTITASQPMVSTARQYMWEYQLKLLQELQTQIQTKQTVLKNVTEHINELETELDKSKRGVITHTVVAPEKKKIAAESAPKEKTKPPDETSKKKSTGMKIGGKGISFFTQYC